jgi:hypothetical protein
MEFQATVGADHEITLLAVPFFSGKTDITAIKCCSNNPVGSLDDKEFDRFLGSG